MNPTNTVQVGTPSFRLPESIVGFPANVTFFNKSITLRLQLLEDSVLALSHLGSLCELTIQ